MGAYYDNVNNVGSKRLWICLATCLTAALPMLYARTFMPYPCNSVNVAIDWEGTDLEEGANDLAAFRNMNCPLEDLLLSPLSLGIGGLVVSGASCLMLLMSLVTKILQTFYLHFGSLQFLHAKRIFWRPLLWLWYFWINPRAYRLKYANEGNIVPCLYTPPSVLVCCIWMVLVLEVGVIGYHMGSPLGGLILGYFMAQLFLLVANYGMGATDDVILCTNGHIENWLPKTIAGGLQPGTFSILNKLLTRNSMMFYDLNVTLEDLQSLKELASRSDANQVSDRMAEDTQDSIGSSIDSIGLITRVYIQESKEVVDLLSGEFTKTDTHLEV